MEHDPVVPRMVDAELAVGAAAREQRFGWVRVSGRGGRGRGAELRERLLEGGHGQVLSVGEVQVNRRRRDPDLPGHAAQGQPVQIAGRRQDVARGLDDLLPQAIPLAARVALPDRGPLRRTGTLPLHDYPSTVDEEL